MQRERFYLAIHVIDGINYRSRISESDKAIAFSTCPMVINNLESIINELNSLKFWTIYFTCNFCCKGEINFYFYFFCFIYCRIWSKNGWINYLNSNNGAIEIEDSAKSILRGIVRESSYINWPIIIYCHCLPSPCSCSCTCRYVLSIHYFNPLLFASLNFRML